MLANKKLAKSQLTSQSPKDENSDPEAANDKQIANVVKTFQQYRQVIKTTSTLYSVDYKLLAQGKITKNQIIQKCQEESKVLINGGGFSQSFQQSANKKIVLDQKSNVLTFPLAERWLNGEEYAFLLRHYRAYTMLYPDRISITHCSHPEAVYEQPKNGQMYFIRDWHLREFGFPRTCDLKKVFKWKKMNFTTDLPKQDPICSYLVATGKVDSECYRMHVVVNSKEYNKEYRKSDVLKELKFCQSVYERNNRNTPGFRHQDKEKQKLLPQDREANTERIILCHVIKIKETVHNADEKNSKKQQLRSKRESKSRAAKCKSKKKRHGASSDEGRSSSFISSEMIPESDEDFACRDRINQMDTVDQDFEPLSFPKNEGQAATDFDEALKLQASLNGRPMRSTRFMEKQAAITKQNVPLAGSFQEMSPIPSRPGNQRGRPRKPSQKRQERLTQDIGCDSKQVGPAPNYPFQLNQQKRGPGRPPKKNKIVEAFPVEGLLNQELHNDDLSFIAADKSSFHFDQKFSPKMQLKEESIEDGMVAPDLYEHIFQRQKPTFEDTHTYKHDQSILGPRKDEKRRPNATLNPEAEFDEEMGQYCGDSQSSSLKRRDESIVQPSCQQRNVINYQGINSSHQYLDSKISNATQQYGQLENQQINDRSTENWHRQMLQNQNMMDERAKQPNPFEISPNSENSKKSNETMRTVSEDIDEIDNDVDRAHDNEDHGLYVQEADHWKATARPQPSDPRHPDYQADLKERPNSSAQILEKIEQEVKSQSMEENLTDLLMKCNETVKHRDLMHDQSENNLQEGELSNEEDQSGQVLDTKMISMKYQTPSVNNQSYEDQSHIVCGYQSQQCSKQRQPSLDAGRPLGSLPPRSTHPEPAAADHQFFQNETQDLTMPVPLRSRFENSEFKNEANIQKENHNDIASQKLKSQDFLAMNPELPCREPNEQKCMRRTPSHSYSNFIPCVDRFNNLNQASCNCPHFNSFMNTPDHFQNFVQQQHCLQQFQDHDHHFHEHPLHLHPILAHPLLHNHHQTGQSFHQIHERSQELQKSTSQLQLSLNTGFNAQKAFCRNDDGNQIQRVHEDDPKSRTKQSWRILSNHRVDVRSICEQSSMNAASALVPKSQEFMLESTASQHNFAVSNHQQLRQKFLEDNLEEPRPHCSPKNEHQVQNADFFTNFGRAYDYKTPNKKRNKSFCRFSQGLSGGGSSSLQSSLNSQKMSKYRQRSRKSQKSHIEQQMTHLWPGRSGKARKNEMKHHEAPKLASAFDVDYCYANYQ